MEKIDVFAGVTNLGFFLSLVSPLETKPVLKKVLPPFSLFGNPNDVFSLGNPKSVF